MLPTALAMGGNLLPSFVPQVAAPDSEETTTDDDDEAEENPSPLRPSLANTPTRSMIKQPGKISPISSSGSSRVSSILQRSFSGEAHNQSGFLEEVNEEEEDEVDETEKEEEEDEEPEREEI